MPLTAVAGPTSRRRGSARARAGLPQRFALAIAVEDLDMVVFTVVDLDPAADGLRSRCPIEVTARRFALVPFRPARVYWWTETVQAALYDRSFLSKGQTSPTAIASPIAPTRERFLDRRAHLANINCRRWPSGSLK